MEYKFHKKATDFFSQVVWKFLSRFGVTKLEEQEGNTRCDVSTSLLFLNNCISVD